MANWFCSVFNVVCVVNVCPRCRSELIDSAWVVIVPGSRGDNTNSVVDESTASLCVVDGDAS